MNGAHGECWFGEPCAVGRANECPPAIAAAKREKGTAWSPLVQRSDPGGLRHYLDRMAVHCGEGIELQSVAFKSDDYGEYTVALQQGIVVRYEAQFDDEIRATLHADVGGHEFTARLHEGMRFRWPVKKP